MSDTFSAEPVDSRFRPLDGESFSKRRWRCAKTFSPSTEGFRPLDGESFSKQNLMEDYREDITNQISFRPLDGESFSKPATYVENPLFIEVSVP